MQGSARKDVVFGAAGVYPCDRARAKMEILAYIALLIFLVLISPDIYWNVKHPDTTVPTLNYAGHLSRIGGIGFTFHYFLFYGRDAIRGAYHLLGWRLKEYMSEYPSMIRCLVRFCW